MIEITTFNPTIWFRNSRKFGTLEEIQEMYPKGGYGTHLICKTIKIARKRVREILNKYPTCEVFIIRHKFKRGKRIIREEIWTRKENLR